MYRSPQEEKSYYTSNLNVITQTWSHYGSCPNLSQGKKDSFWNILTFQKLSLKLKSFRLQWRESQNERLFKKSEIISVILRANKLAHSNVALIVPTVSTESNGNTRRSLQVNESK